MNSFKDNIYYLWIDILDFLAIIQMEMKHFIKRKHYNSLSEKDIPKNTLYCYSGCRIYGKRCPYLDYSGINKGCFCHYEHKFDFLLLNDECKICGINEGIDEEWQNTS